ncbi:MAG: hypothetical protein OXF27_06650 [Acidobacteria bacterium]|nr:hypothetical protein [Acidobacteriota bacterium]
MTGLRVLIGVLALAAGAAAQGREAEPVEVRCPSVLGVGVATEVPFCDIEVQNDPVLGVRVVLPPHRGEATLAFDLHNRHAYSETETRAGRAYTQYQAAIAVATMEGEVIARGIVLSEFRSAGDLIDRVGDGAGSGALSAVAPIGVERLFVTLPAGIDQVSVVGQSLDVLRADGRDTFNTAGRPIAVMSNATLSYRPR